MENRMAVPYETKPMNRPSMLLRFLGRQPKKNGLVAINNLLADAENVEDVSVEQVEVAAAEYRMRTRRDFKEDREQIFKDFLEHCIADHCLEEIEITRLVHLRRILRLTEGDAARIQDAVASSVYAKAVDGVLMDNIRSDDESAFLERLSQNLQLPTALSEKILSAKSQEIVQRAFDAAVSDQRLSPSEDGELQALAENLGITIKHNEETRLLLDKVRLYWRIEEGDIPTVTVDIKLQRGESCYFEAQVDWLEERRVTHRYNYSGPQARIRIAKGVYWRLGSMAVKPTSEDVLKHIDSGVLYVTNKRVLFRGQRGNKSIRLNRIIHIEPYGNGVEIEKDAGKNPFLQFNNGSDVMAMILERAIDDSASA